MLQWEIVNTYKRNENIESLSRELESPSPPPKKDIKENKKYCKIKAYGWSQQQNGGVRGKEFVN